MLTTRAAGASRAAVGLVRAFSTTPTAFKPRADIGKFNLTQVPTFQFDDASSLEHRRLMGIEESRELIATTITDAEALAAQARKHPYKPPTGTIRLTSQVDLSDPNSEYTAKRVLLAPVSSLPLKNAEAIQRFKVLAGPRWTPGKPGRGELGTKAPLKLAKEAEEDKLGKEGYVKISEDRYPEARMNRKSVSDMLERLVEAANDPKSPLPADTPVDPSHLLARQRKRRTQNVYARALALDERKEVVGGIRGFPKEWLSKEAQAKLGKA